MIIAWFSWSFTYGETSCETSTKENLAMQRAPLAKAHGDGPRPWKAFRVEVRVDFCVRLTTQSQE